jgi:hypothetical protein
MNTNDSRILGPMRKGLVVSLFVVQVLAVPVYAQGLIAFNNLANNNVAPAQIGGLVYLTPPSGAELLNQLSHETRVFNFFTRK